MKMLKEDLDALHDELATIEHALLDGEVRASSDLEQPRKRRALVSYLINDAQLIEPTPYATGYAGVGTIVRFVEDGVTSIVRIGGEWVSPKRAQAGWIRCSCPLGVALLGAGVGDVLRCRFGGRDRVLRIIGLAFEEPTGGAELKEEAIAS